MKDTTKIKRGTQKKKVSNKRTEVNQAETNVNMSEVVQSYLDTKDLVSVDEFAKVTGVKKKDLTEALDSAGAEFFRYDMMQKVPCSSSYKGEVYAQEI